MKIQHFVSCLGRYDAGLSLLREAVATRQTVLGETDPDTKHAVRELRHHERAVARQRRKGGGAGGRGRGRRTRRRRRSLIACASAAASASVHCDWQTDATFNPRIHKLTLQWPPPAGGRAGGGGGSAALGCAASHTAVNCRSLVVGSASAGCASSTPPQLRQKGRYIAAQPVVQVLGGVSGHGGSPAPEQQAASKYAPRSAMRGMHSAWAVPHAWRIMRRWSRLSASVGESIQSICARAVCQPRNLQLPARLVLVAGSGRSPG